MGKRQFILLCEIPYSYINYRKLKHGGKVGFSREAVRKDDAVSISQIRVMEAHDETVQVCPSSDLS